MNSQKPSNLEIYETFRKHLDVDNPEYKARTFWLPLKLGDFKDSQFLNLSHALQQALDGRHKVKGISRFEVGMPGEGFCEGLAVHFKSSIGEDEVRVAIRTNQAVGAVLECEVTEDAILVCWPTDALRLHVIILSEFDMGGYAKRRGMTSLLETEMYKYIQYTKPKTTSEFEKEQVDWLAGGLGTAYRWHDFLKWSYENMNEDRFK